MTVHTDFGFTPGEVRIVIRLVEGKTNKEIAKELWLSEDTVKWHMGHILKKLRARNRTHAVAIAIRNGW